MSVSLETLGINRLSVAERAELARAILENITTEGSSLSEEQTRKIAHLITRPTTIHTSTQWEHVETETLAQMIHDHDLNPDEIVRLLRVFWDYEPVVQKPELEEELRCILAARGLAKWPQLTNETIDKARAAFASGRVPFVQQDMD